MLAGFKSRCTRPCPCSCVLSLDDLLGDAEGFFQRNRTLPDALSQGRAFDQLHQQVVGPDVVEGADVRMIQRGDGTGFAFKAIGELMSGDFDGDIAVQSRITGSPHFSHSSLAEERDDLIGAEAVSWSEGH